MRRPLVLLAASAIAVAAAVEGCGGSTPEQAIDPVQPPDASVPDPVETGTGLDLDGGLDAGKCVPRTCATEGKNCGPIADGCGGLIECGTCTAPDFCGGGGAPSVCGKPACTKKTCADLGASCGPQGDGCGGVLDCGTCAAPETCGGGGTPSACGVIDTGPGCVPKTCKDHGFDCGPAGDGCGGLLDCGTCASPSICGGGGEPGVCGGPTCMKTTCAKEGATCGPIGDGCGGIITSCGTCKAPDICGGGGVPSQCGGGGADASPCVGLECDKPTCASGVTTSISGVVRDPAGKVPLYGVQVYVPNTTPAAFVDGATCDRCADALSGSPIAVAVTDTQGRFTVKDVPAGASIPLVIQSGKWRRQITIPIVSACVDNPILDGSLTRLPRNKSEGDIPKIALTTGGADPLECLLRKIGLDDAEITSSSGTGRVHLYAGSGGSARLASGGDFANATTLWSSVESLKKYDVVLFACEGAQNTSTKPTSARQALVDYAALGGRVFATHWHNVWIEQGPAPWPSTATWNFAADLASPITAKVDQTFPKGKALAEWLVHVGASTVLGDLRVNAGQHTVDAVNSSSAIAWITASGVKDVGGKTVPSAVQYYTFNTPIGVSADAQCGRVVFTDIHVSSSDSVNKPFPNGCTTSDLSPQEKALEFMLFDLTSKICDDKAPPPPPPTCEPRTCTEAGAECGPVADGCGALLDCGPCTAPGETCGGGGVPGKCGKPTCTPRTCADQGLECGPAGDGCGKTIDCGACTPPDTCGGAGVPGKCGHTDAGTCVPLTCDGRCGPQSDGCGGLLSCPACDGGTCTPTTCAAHGAECGAIPDGCGGLLSCGDCVPPATCGGGGVANECGGVK